MNNRDSVTDQIIEKPRLIDFFEYMRASIHTSRIEVDECLLLNYQCYETGSDRVWFKESHFVFVLTGEKVWEFHGELFEAKPGDVVFIKQGSSIIHHSSSAEFCAIILFLPHKYISQFVVDNKISVRNVKGANDLNPLIRLEYNIVLEGFRNSILAYLADSKIDARPVVQVKLLEILQYAFSHEQMSGVARYLLSSIEGEKHHVQYIMEGNFMLPLRLEDYADMCNMSLSTFKRKFREYYGDAPGAWLLNQRMELARKFLTSSSMTIQEIADACGFNSTSYFVKSFRKKFDITPLQYRKSG